MFRISTLLRVLGRTALILYFLAAALFLVVKYGILPNIDQWRPRIQAELSAALDTRISLGRIDASWQGWHPRFELNDVALFDDLGNKVLGLPRIRATLSWQGLLSGLPRFSYIEAIGLQIEARRDTQQRIWILGQDIDVHDNGRSSEFSLEHPAIQWLAQQPRVVLRDAVITWRDQARNAGPLRLEAVTLGLASQPGQHQIVISATPPQLLGQQFEMRAKFDHVNQRLARIDPMAWEGVFYVHVDGMQPRQWQPWMDLPGNMRSGNVSAKWWLTFSIAEPRRVAAQVRVKAGDWQLAGENRLRADEIKLFLDGSWPAYAANLDAFEALLAPDLSAQTAAYPPSKDELPVTVQIDARGLQLELPELFDHALVFEQFLMHGGVQRNGDRQLTARFDNARLINQDMDVQLSGTWSEGGTGQAGVADLRGVFHRASLDGIDLYLPESVNLEAREWLIAGLLDGQLENATALLQGDLERFPFGDGSGQFRIEGNFRDGVIDYAPGQTEQTAWPPLRNVNGRASLDRVDLRLVADEAVIYPAQGHAIQLRDVKAHIPDIELDSILSVEGETQAPASAYLALARHSPLQRLLDGFLDPAQADGDWQVPLRLTIPLLNVDDTQVRGAVQFNGGTVALEPQAPPFEQVHGTLEFSETGFSANGLKARFLDGPTDLSGGVGGARKGLDMKGSISADALAKYVGMKGMERLKGSLAYQAQLRRRASGRYAMTAQSNLQGMAINLPAPVGKTKDAVSRLEVQWVPAQAASDMHLNIALGPVMRAKFARREGKAKGPYFYTGAIGTALPEKLPTTGLHVDSQYQHIDVDEWADIIDDFSTPLADSGEIGRTLFPPLQRMRLQADRMSLYGLVLDDASLTAGLESPLRWRMDVVSAKTAGTLFWNQADAQSSGSVDARFDRLALGAVPDAQEPVANGAEHSPPKHVQDDEDWERDLDIPAVDLKVDKLNLYGRNVGQLAVQGVSEQGGRFWRLNKLSLTSPSAQMHGSGIWRLAGAQRGLTVDANVGFSDLGAFLNQIEFKNMMEGGRGSLKGRFEWRNMPWRFDRSDLNGQLRLQLEQGRFSTLNSGSARLLELLSLQSIQRLATLSLNPASIFKEGFPFDSVAGTLHIKDGVMTTNDYRVGSPVATISIGGDIDLKTKKIDAQAMVIPNLDVSGATVAAGIAINPIVGLGAFVTQWLLRKPLSKAMTVHYDVSGDLDSPKLREVAASQPSGPVPDAQRIEGAKIELDGATEGGLRSADELIKRNGG